MSRIATLVLASLLWLGCDRPAGVTVRCVKGARAECPCDGGAKGVKTCGASGAFGACDCGR